jgi:hypothetical protein
VADVRFTVNDEELQQLLNRLTDSEMSQFILFEIGKRLHDAMEGRTPVGILTQTRRMSGAEGHAKAAWTAPLTTGDNTIEFMNPLIYSIPLEFGSEPGSRPWPNPGPRTTLASNFGGDTRVYSRQAPGGMFDPAVEEDLNITEMLNALIQQYMDAQ